MHSLSLLLALAALNLAHSAPVHHADRKPHIRHPPEHHVGSEHTHHKHHFKRADAMIRVCVSRLGAEVAIPSNGQCNGDNQLVDMDRNNPLFLQHIGIFEVPNTSNGNNQIVNSDQDPSNTQRATGNPSNSNQGPDGGLFPNDGLLPVSDNSGNSDGLFGGNTGTTFLGFPGSQDPNPGGGVRRLTAGLTASLLGGGSASSSSSQASASGDGGEIGNGDNNDFPAAGSDPNSNPSTQASDANGFLPTDSQQGGGNNAGDGLRDGGNTFEGNTGPAFLGLPSHQSTASQDGSLADVGVSLLGGSHASPPSSSSSRGSGAGIGNGRDDAGGAFDPNGGSSFDHGDDRPVFPGQFPHGASDGLVDPTDEGGFPDGTHPDGFGADSSLPGGLDNDPDNSQLGGLIDGGSESDTLPEGPEGSWSNPPDNSQIGGFDDLHPTISDGVYAHGPDGNPEGSTPDALHHDDSPADTDQHRHGAGSKHHLGNGSRLEGDSDDPRFGDIHSDQGSHRDHLFDGDHDGPRFNDWTAPHGRLNGLPFGPGHDHTLGDDSQVTDDPFDSSSVDSQYREDVPSDPDSSPHRPTHSPSEHPHAGANPSNRFGYFDPGPVRFHRRPHDIHVSPGNNGLPHSRITHDTKHYRFSYYFGYFFMSSYPSSAWAKRDRS